LHGSALTFFTTPALRWLPLVQRLTEWLIAGLRVRASAKASPAPAADGVHCCGEPPSAHYSYSSHRSHPDRPAALASSAHAGHLARQSPFPAGGAADLSGSCPGE